MALIKICCFPACPKHPARTRRQRSLLAQGVTVTVRPLHIHSRSLRHDLISGRFYLRRHQGRGGRGGWERWVMGRGKERERDVGSWYQRRGCLKYLNLLFTVTHIKSQVRIDSFQFSFAFKNIHYSFLPLSQEFTLAALTACMQSTLSPVYKLIASLPITVILGILLQWSYGGGAHPLPRRFCEIQHRPIWTWLLTKC